MKIQKLNIVITCLIALMVIACDSQPRVIEAQSVSASVGTNSIPALEEAEAKPNLSVTDIDEHVVVVEEVLNTSKYSYLQVKENNEKYWVAISKTDVNVGETYYFKGGLLKRNFQSREFNKVFDKVYLVSNIWKKNEEGGSALAEAAGKAQEVDLEVGNIEMAEGATKLSELFENKEQFKDQTIKITGKSVKVNPMIMGRNWVHIQDSSGENYDLTVTTTENIPLGAVVTLEGTIALDKDFGAGYRYDIIMEGAIVTGH